MKTTISIFVVFIVLGMLLFFWRRKRKSDRCEVLVERSFQFLETFCCLREEQEVLGSAYLNFRRVNSDKINLGAEILLFFPGSRVILREDVGTCIPEEVTALREALCERVAVAYPGIEINAGAYRICFR